MDRFSLTTPIFYANARPHIGSAYTVLLADVLARFQCTQGKDVFFLTGTDEHGGKIAEAALAEGKDPQTFVDDVSAQFEETWRALAVAPSLFFRTSSARHREGVHYALTFLHNAGLLYEKTYRGLYCTGCEKFVTEKELDENGLEPLHQKKPIEVEEKNWFFKLSEFLPQVQQAIEQGDISIAPLTRRNEVLGLFAQGLEDFSVSRVRERVPWGIPLPFDDTQTTYVWVDALLNYITALGYGSDTVDQLHTYWPVDVHLLGQDILKFHAIYWPALLLALHVPLPKRLLVHGFFTVDGQKISKSLGNAIDPQELIDAYGVDGTRYLLATSFPFGNSGDIDRVRLRERYTAELADTYGNLVSRTWALLKKYADGNVPEVSCDPALQAPIESAYARIVTSELDVLPNILHEEFLRLGKWLNVYINEKAPWKKEGNNEERLHVLRTVVEGIFHLTGIGAPFFPAASERVAAALGNTTLPTTANNHVEAGAHILDLPPLFPKMHD